MRVIVKLFGGLNSGKDFKRTEEGDIIFESVESYSVGQLIDALSLNKKPFIVIHNGIILTHLDIKLKDGDEISLFPPIAGG